jgi:hypothetical protein
MTFASEISNPLHAPPTMHAVKLYSKFPTDVLPIIRSFLFFTEHEWKARKKWVEVLQTLKNAVRVEINRYGCGHWIYYFQMRGGGPSTLARDEPLQLQMIHCLQCGGYDHPWRGVACPKVRCTCEPSYAEMSRRW